MPIKSVKIKISKNKKMRFLLKSQGLLNQKIRFLGQKMWPVAHAQTHTHTHRHTHTDTLGSFATYSVKMTEYKIEVSCDFGDLCNFVTCADFHAVSNRKA